MAITKIGTHGVKDDAITSGKIPANAVGSSEIADDAVTSAQIADNAVVRAAINAEAVSTSKIEGLAVTTAKIADQAVDLTKLPHGTSSNDGKFLRANNGADPTFETVSIPAGTTINNNADNRVITGSGTANTLNGESSVLIDSSSRIQRGSDPSNLGTAALNIVDGGGYGINISRNQGAACTDDQRMGAIAFHSGLGGQSTVTGGASIEAFAEENQSGSTNATRLVFNTKPSGTGPGSAPTERMRIHSNGAVSIANTRNYYGALNVEAGVVTTDSSAIDIKASGTNKKILSFGDHNTISGELRLTPSSHIDFGTSSNHPLIFYTGSSRTERMRITSDGYVYAIGQAGSYISNTGLYHQFINTGNGRWTMQIKQEHHNGMNTQMLVNSVTNIEAFQIYSTSNNTTRFRVLNNGNVGSASNSYGGISDIKLKENIVDAKSQWDDIKAVKVRNFNFKDTPDTKMLGVVAQEIETVSPSLVSEIVDRDPNDSTKEIGTTKEVKYSILYMKAIKCLQEAMAKIEVLETKVTDLEAA